MFEAESSEEMFDKERELVEVGSHSYNLRSGGVGGWTKEEARKGREATNKILEEKYGLNWRSVVAQKANQASQLSEYGRVRRRETLSEKFSFQGRTHSEESRKKMSETAKRRLQKREKTLSSERCGLLMVSPVARLRGMERFQKDGGKVEFNPTVSVAQLNRARPS